MEQKCRIDIQPVDSPADQPLTCVKISGLPANQNVEITAETVDDAGSVWLSRAVYTSSESGTVDLSEQTPESGTFSEKDPSAILWSMRPAGATGNPVPLFAKKTTAPLKVKVAVNVNRLQSAELTIKRYFISQKNDVIREEVNLDGLVGTLFYPDTEGPHPVVICLSGSGGGIDEPRASLIASRGYAAFALGYFGLGSLPQELIDIPLEFLERGLSWLRKHDSVDCGRIAVYGYSKGGELSLLLGSLYPEIKAVVAFSGSSYVWQGMHYGRPAGSWTRNGKELPYIPMKVPFHTIVALIRRKKVAFRETYERGLAGTHDIEAATIRVENINGPVFLVAGTDDQVWPAAVFADAISERLNKHKHKFPCECMKVQGAGHLVGMPFLPGAETAGNLVFTSSDINKSTLAVIKAWESMIVFLDRNL